MKPATKTLSTLAFILAFSASYSQQANNWYFGYRSGITFNTPTPQSLTNGNLYTDEGCSSMSDGSGSILFYSDGRTVWNKLHIPMPNGTGLMGHYSSTNSAIIVPKPRDSTKYFVFTCDAGENALANGYRYSLVDMSLNGGLGDVVNKNILLYSPSTEKLTALKSANGIDYWIITKEWNNNRFKVYKLDCSGVSINPVISDEGIAVTSAPDFYLAAIGAMKASPDGRKLAMAIEGGPNSGVELFDFNNNTGQLSNPVFLTGYHEPNDFPYGVEFSPNSSLLYVSAPGLDQLHQFNISLGTAAAINASKIILPASLTHNALQLGPDNKIYVANLARYSLCVINNPDIYGPGCNVAESAVLLDKICMAGLPATITSNFNPNNQIDFISSFINCYVQYSGTANFTGTLKWYWDFGDNKSDSGQTVTHSYKSAGNYNVKLTVLVLSSCGAVDTFRTTKPITINSVFAVDFGYTGHCLNDAYQFNDSTILTVGNITGRNWEFGDGGGSTIQNPSHNYTTTGAYSVKLVVSTNGICRADSITRTVYVDAKPSAFFSANDGCVNQDIFFTDLSTNGTGGITNWNWDFADGNLDSIANPVHKFINAGSYNIDLLVSSQHGCSSFVSKPVIIESFPLADFKFDSSCYGRPIQFTDMSNNIFGSIVNWQWNFGDGNSSVVQNPLHTYFNYSNYNVKLQVVTANGCASPVFSKTVPINSITIFAGRDTMTAAGQPLQLLAVGASTYTWAPSSGLNNANIANPVAILQQPQVYIVKGITQAGCIGYDTLKIVVFAKADIYVPAAFTPNNDGKNDLLRPVCVGIKSLDYFTIYNRWGQVIFTTKEMNKGWNGNLNGRPQATAGFVWVTKGVTYDGRVIERKGTFTLIR